MILSFTGLHCSSILTSRKKVDLPPGTVTVSIDDGPNAHNHITDSVLAVFSRHNVTGYFCLIGMNVERYPEIVKRIHDAGHVIVNHGYTDRFVFNKNMQEVERDIAKCNSAIGAALGIDNYCAQYYRPPHGLYRSSTREVWRKPGMKLLPITFYALDAQRDSKKAGKVIAKTIRRVKKDKGGIILLHDGRDGREKLLAELEKDSTCSYDRSWVPAALDSIITVLKREGFVFE